MSTPPKGGCLTQLDVKAGQAVVKGQRLAVLENKDLDMEIAKLVAKEKEYEVKLEVLQALDHSDHKSAETIPQLEKALESVRKQRQEEEADRDRLILKAARDGTVLPPPPTPATHQEEIEGGPLPSWSGTPLDEENYRPFLKEGVLFCLVGDPRNLEAVLVIDQGDIDFVKPDQEVDLKFDALPHDTLHGKIERISVSNLKITPRRLSTKAERRVAQQERSGDRRGDAAKRVVPGHRADQRRRRRDDRRPPRPGQDPHRAALARRPALAADHEHLQLPALIGHGVFARGRAIIASRMRPSETRFRIARSDIVCTRPTLQGPEP